MLNMTISHPSWLLSWFWICRFGGSSSGTRLAPRSAYTDKPILILSLWRLSVPFFSSTMTFASLLGKIIFCLPNWITIKLETNLFVGYVRLRHFFIKSPFLLIKRHQMLLAWPPMKNIGPESIFTNTYHHDFGVPNSTNNIQSTCKSPFLPIKHHHILLLKSPQRENPKKITIPEAPYLDRHTRTWITISKLSK